MIQERGNIEDKEMFRTFNMGVGMVMILGSRAAQKAIPLFEKTGQKAWIIGEVVEGKRKVLLF